MLCPYCRAQSSKVVDKRDNNQTNVIRRRRECLVCEKRYTTYERLTSIDLNVVKRSGRTEKFDREKLKAGINRAVKKRAIGDSKIDEIIDDIELKLLNRKATEIRSTDIGKMVLTRLKKIDEIGYILFSAVYNGFNDIDDLSDAIKIIKTS